ncbi:uncharacterized protein LOC110712326 [Chenopodium quinoa]|uniref:uncharacterized protein LOC110712326 n=1 Tax=Chenopodium quinoa TaxID=63459 RepID=UPI000B76CCB2|nr:uncharacterized protein LOC110712326 [Chenopodium quinoa]
MIVTSWNCRGLNDVNSPKLPYVFWLLHSFVPNFLFLSETKVPVSVVTSLLSSSNPSSVFGVDSVGSSGGLVVFGYGSDDVSCVFCCSNVVLCNIKIPIKISRCVMFVYGAPVVEDRPQAWGLILDLLAIAPNCLIIGDINQVERNYDRLGGSTVIKGWESFIDFSLKASLISTPFKGPPYTWTNNRQAHKLILQRLDRSYMTSDWFHNYPDSRLINQPIFISDHAAIVFDDSPFHHASNRPYQLDNWCLNFTQVHDFVRDTWQRNTLGSPMFILSTKLANVKILIRRWCLNNKKYWGVDWKNFSKELSVEGESIRSVPDAAQYMSNIVTSKESIFLQLQFWRQRCKKNWILQGVCPSKVLFSKFKSRQKKNHITSLLDEQGVLQFGQTKVQNVVLHSLKNTFKSDAIPSYDPDILIRF